MKRLMMILAVGLILALSATGKASGYLVTDDFETAWAGDYASGWVNVNYAHGDASTPKMTQYAAVTANGHAVTPVSGSDFMGLQIIAVGDPVGSTEWWGGVVPEFVNNAHQLDRQYNPWVSVSFYDCGVALPSPQLAAVPNTDDPNDWTDIQLGQRWNRADNYWYSEAMNKNSDGGWIKTSVARSVGWHELSFTLDTSGYITYSIDGTSIGTTIYNTYMDLAAPWLMTQFQDGVFGITTEVYFDNFQSGSDYVVPEPGALSLVGLGLVGLVRRRRRS